ncbi:MAG TPA: 3-hydroxyacyl-CoA dehydrogenase NAD-binding domain-containing protein [Burkholderiaceae bacterium]|nr:3-hydroxyacyl-CoA dehydrogenase NAD-binding domain-containing protein [Burkholderiaceae bacterium]
MNPPSKTHAIVVGGGTMGADVAVVLLRAQCRTTIVEPDASRHATIAARTDAGLAHLDCAENSRYASIVSSLDEADWASAGLVIECIPEQLDLKQKLFGRLVELSTPDTVLCSNSSSYPISDIAQGLPTRNRMLGLHFFMPAHIVPLVEVVLSADTEAGLGESLAAFMRRCGSVPVLVRKDVPGFLANRLQHALAREAYALIEQGIASPEDIDAAVRFGFGFRYLAAGPVLQRDHGGLDVHCAAARSMYPTLCNDAAPAAILAERADAGKTGMKAGEGFYTWTPESIAAERKRYDAMLRAGLELLAGELPKIQP